MKHCAFIIIIIIIIIITTNPGQLILCQMLTLLVPLFGFIQLSSCRLDINALSLYAQICLLCDFHNINERLDLLNITYSVNMLKQLQFLLYHFLE